MFGFVVAVGVLLAGAELSAATDAENEHNTMLAVTTVSAADLIIRLIGATPHFHIRLRLLLKPRQQRLRLIARSLDGKGARQRYRTTTSPHKSCSAAETKDGDDRVMLH